MPIATSHSGSKVGFIHIPKCGGTSLEHSLGIAEEYPNIGVEVTITKPHNERLFGGGLQHLTCREIVRNHEARWSETDWTFAVIRHPLDRLISHLFWRVCRFEGFEGTNDELFPILENLIQEAEDLARSNASFHTPFEGYEFDHTVAGALALNDPQRHLLPQASFLFSKGEVKIDRIYLLSNLPRLEECLKSEGFLDRPLAHRMKRHSHHNFIDHISDRMRERVEILYKVDYEIFSLVTLLSKARRDTYADGVELGIVKYKFPVPARSDSCVSKNLVPRKVWMYWDQGQGEAPPMIKDCISSWKIMNPQWQVKILDRNSLTEYLSLPDFYPAAPEITLTSFSDIVRIYLLERYGGVWVDATVWCMRPLDEWVDDAAAATGFFAFSNVGKIRPLGSWFLAAHENNKMISKWRQATDLLWFRYSMRHGSHIFEALFEEARDSFEKVLSASLQDRLELLLWQKEKYSRIGPEPLGNLLSSDPESKYYFWFQALFAVLLVMDEEFSSAWGKVAGASAIEPHYLQQFGIHNLMTAEVQQHIENVVCNLYKLNRREPIPAIENGTIWGFLKQRLREVEEESEEKSIKFGT